MIEVAEGIFQVPLPLPFPLRVVHAYLMRDGRGWTVVDAGLNYPPARAAWEEALGQLGVRFGQIERIVLTHAHPDHYGLAGWLAERSGAPVYASPVEQRFAQRTWEVQGQEQRAVVDFLSGYGVPGELLAVLDSDIAALREMTRPSPPQMVSLLPGEALQIGGRRFAALPAPGHSDGQLALYCAEERLLLCGDAVLLKITPNVGRWPEGDRDPLATFLATLARLRELEVDLALPGHGPLIRAFRERVDELAAHHEERLEATLAAADGADAFQICGRIFTTETLTSHQLRFAMAETIAHLEHLVARGRVVRVGEGPVRYRASYDGA